MMSFNVMWCLRNWIFTQKVWFWICWIDFFFLSVFAFLLMPSPHFSSPISSHSHPLHLLFSIFSIFFLWSLRPLSSRPFFYPSTCFGSCLPLSLPLFPFHTLSLTGGCFGPCDLWPPVSQCIGVIRGWSRKWKWGGGVGEDPAKAPPCLQHPISLQRPRPPPDVRGRILKIPLN